MRNDVEPGWRPDPTDSGQIRYWDGEAWTDEVAPTVAQAVQDPDDDFSALMGIPDDRDRRGRAVAISIGVVAGVLVLALGWWNLAGGDGDGAVGDSPAPDGTEVLGRTDTGSGAGGGTPSTVDPLVPVVAVDGMSLPEALGALGDTGLTVTIAEVEDESADPGIVVGQDPPPGELPRGSDITLTVAIEPAPECNDIVGPIPPTTFVDVIAYGSPTDAIAVGWAQQNDIISGVGADLFGVDQPLTRGGLVSVLHRYFCEPAPGAPSSFTDISGGEFYAAAAAWAAEKGIVTGTSDTEFDPDGTTTRAQWVTVLWRALGQPEGHAEIPFADVPPGAFYEPALRWAVANNLVAGTTPSTFGAGAPLTRLDATSLLYLLESTVDPAVT